MKRNTSIPYKQIALQQAERSKVIQATEEALIMVALYTLYMDLDLEDEQIDLFMDKFVQNIVDVGELGLVNKFTEEMSFILEDDLGIKFTNHSFIRVKPSKANKGGES